ncbi:MAG: DUF1553 domain-containing protein [Planctomycetota bacterium]|nr:DUF1553 domain-containing protein [Planctomycetota bacterium]
MCNPTQCSRRPTASAASLWIWLLILTGLFFPLPCVAADPVFEKDVLPLFTRYCFNCHGKSSPQLGLDLRSARRALRGSQNGPVIVPGSLEKSLLWKMVSTREMPLKLFKLEMKAAEIDTVRRWILAGAPAATDQELPAEVQAQFAAYDKSIQPILTAHCTACHGGDEPDAQLNLESLTGLVRGSVSGPVIQEGFSEKSVLIRKVASHVMPPPEEGPPLTSQQIRTITAWIDRGHFSDYVDTTTSSDGAAAATSISPADRNFWSFQPPAAAPLPTVAARHRARTPIDHFLIRALESQGLTYSPPASRRTLLRRAYFDLLGTPPSPSSAQHFLDDSRPDHYERLLDNLLASPRYGERWGRHWLDVVGYIDTTGKDFNPTTATLSPGFWRYRDYVIRATNADKPWDRFLTEQIAGDELVDWRNAPHYTPEIRDLLTATGFLRNVLDATDEDISNLPFDRYEALFKLMERFSSSTLGLTLACARCHDHKFDPIPQVDYYRFLSLFTSAYNPTQWLPPKERHLYTQSRQEQVDIAEQKQRLEMDFASLSAAIDKHRSSTRSELFDTELAKLPEADRATAKQAFQTDEKTRSAVQKTLVAKYNKQLTITDGQVDRVLPPEVGQQVASLELQIRKNRETLKTLTLQKIQALWDVGPAPTIRLLHRGDVDFAGPKVSAGFLSVLSAASVTHPVRADDAVGETTGMRLALAKWLTNPAHPLTARVIVNRSWQHHFGQGIVRTPGNFGASGAKPTHPELLDWLSVDFVRLGYSAKRLHHQLMSSSAYRQDSGQSQSRAAALDPANHYLWKMNMRRLDAEALRDSVLAISHRADYVMGGPPVALESTPSGLQTVSRKAAANGAARRSIYLLARRTYPLSLLGVFDYPIIDVNCTHRVPSATPLQSLTMINSAFFSDNAAHFARRVRRQLGADAAPADQIRAAYWIAFVRPPSEQETAAAHVYLNRLTELHIKNNLSTATARQRSLESFVHMLQCSNEFLYID